MTRMSHQSRPLAALALCLALGAPGFAQAQTLPYGNADASGDGFSQPSQGDAPSVSDNRRGGGNGSNNAGGGRSRLKIAPYIEALQVATAQISPGNEMLTYSALAAGIDATMKSRRTEGTMSLRYERRFGWGKASSSDNLSGIARLSATVIPNTVRFEAGGMAARTRIDGNGSAIIAPLTTTDAVTQIYSVYAGPALSTHAGPVAIDGSYRLGYSRVDTPSGLLTAAGQAPVDVFNHSLSHSANIHAGTKPGDVLPVGLGVGAGYNQEDVSNLDQRVRDMHVRGDVTIPISANIALVGGVGYEKVQISSRDALRDANGVPIIGSNGRYVTDTSKPRVMAYDVKGLIWDAGVIWRPSRRTAFEAHVGRRYGSTSVYGSFAYAPNDRSALNIAVYDNIAGFGGQLSRALAALPTDFQTVRNPLTGDITGCVASLAGGNCLSGALGSIRSATFRSRGVMASYSHTIGRLNAGISGGYDRRRFIAAPGTVLAAANGAVDQSYWLNAYLSGRIDEKSNFTTNAYVNWFQSGFTLAGDGKAMGATASYNRSLTQHLSATAALGIDGISRETLDDIWNASALVGVRYTF